METNGLVAGWAEEPETGRASWQLEWYELLSRLAELDREYRAGTMTVAQQDRFLALHRKVQGQAQLLLQIGVDSRFPIGTDEAIG